MTCIVSNPARQVVNVPACTPEQIEANWRAIQDMFEAIGYPQLPRDASEVPPPTNPALSWTYFQLAAGFTAGKSDDAAVLNLLGTSTSEAMDVYDPLGLMSSAVATDQGLGMSARHPTTGEMVLFVVAPIGGGGGSGANDKVKVNSSDTADFLAAQFADTGTYNASDHTLVLFDVHVDASNQLMRAFVVDADMPAGTDEKVKVASGETSAGYLSEQLVNSGALTDSDKWARVYFNVGTGSNTMYAEYFITGLTRVNADDDLAAYLEDQFEDLEDPGTYDEELHQLVSFQVETDGDNRTLRAFVEILDYEDSYLVLATDSDGEPSTLLDAIDNTGDPDEGYQRVEAKPNDDGSKIVLQTAEATEGGGDGHTIVEFQLEDGQSLSASTYVPGTRTWTDGTGSACLITAGVAAATSSAITLKNPYPRVYTAPSGKLYKGLARYNGSDYKLVTIHLCDALDNA